MCTCVMCAHVHMFGYADVQGMMEVRRQFSGVRSFLHYVGPRTQVQGMSGQHQEFLPDEPSCWLQDIF